MDLEQQRKRAKDLRRAHAAGDPVAIDRIERWHPRVERESRRRVISGDATHTPDRFRLSDAQLVIAREAGFPSWPAMVHVLDGDPSELLVRAVQSGKPDVVLATLGTDPPWWQVIWALRAGVELNAPIEMIRALVAVAVRPSVREPALLDAIRLHRGVEMIEVLLGESATLANAAMRAASRYDHATALALLARRGVSDDALSNEDRAIAAAMRGINSGLVVAFADDDHCMIAWAVRAGRADALPRLLALGLDPDVLDVEGETALHVAVDRADDVAIAALLAAGARTDIRDYDGSTVEGRYPIRQTRALTSRDQVMRPDAIEFDRAADAVVAATRTLVHRPDAIEFDRAADAVVAGDGAALAHMLAATPALVHARSERPHRAMLLHYCAANGVEDPRQRTPPNIAAIADQLLAAGADPNATCTLYRGAQTTVGLMLTSIHPRAAGVDGALVEVLARHGAKLGRAELVTAIMHGSPLAVSALVRAGVPVADLFVAAGVGDLVRLRELLAIRPTSIDQREPDRSTALHAAAAMNQSDAARSLLAAGADRTIRETRWDATAADLAAHFGHAELAALLA